MPTPQKEAIIQEMTEKFSNAKSFFLADFSGMDVNTVTQLRKNFRDAEVEYRVIKNTLAKRSLHSAGIKEMDDFLVGINAYAISYGDPTKPIKVIEKHKKELGDKFKVKAAYFEGKVVEEDRLSMIAKLPSRDELLGTFVGMVQSPMTKFAATLKAAMGEFVGVLKALEETKK